MTKTHILPPAVTISMSPLASKFETYQGRVRPRRLLDHEVSLTKTNILLSAALAPSFAGIERVVLLFNRGAQEIGIRPAQANENGYKLSQRSISATSFFRHFKIEPRGRFPAHINRFGMLIIALRAKPAPKLG